MLIYTVQESLVMHYRQGTLFTSALLKNENRDREFTDKDGFNIAFAVIDTGSATFEDVAGRDIHDYL